MKTFEEFWLKHKAGLQTGQGYDWNIDPGQRVLINAKTVSFERIKELEKQKIEDGRYRDATPWEVWLRKNIDINAWKDLVDMAYDDAVQILLPPAGKDPDGEPKKIIYPLDAVNRHERPEEKYNKTYYGEDIYKLEQGNAYLESLARFNPVFTEHGIYQRSYVPSTIKGFYYNREKADDQSEAKHLYYPISIIISNKRSIHKIYRVRKEQATNMSKSAIMTPTNLFKEVKK
ncbi:hypothetical protein [Microscilla marina]|uniref:Uncharacterized protein n=1 Tax=Microscilla marina ATCC 23134 TaxID=313606 RepID=A1ZXN7_MICM2|nr:hypothetical protein [Microscilla marina]EAY24815.1 hypothetical protein M23134_06707 [Microscilla marina ATCC 23134]